MHHIDLPLPPDGVDPAVHGVQVRADILAACEAHGEVELRYPNSSPDRARLVDGELVVTSAEAT